MKNLIMTVAAAATLLFSTQCATAQETENTDVAVNSTEVQAPIQDGFEKVETSTLPKIITDAVLVDKAGAQVSEAYINEDLKVYKLELQIEGQDPQTAFINEVGRWVEIK
ncbi:hypothetical protein [Leeuwenhoekiella sp. LLG6367-2.1]|uniref:hypothetical protein n=1 Tax=Leeuwenhoekiella sp. LLG6367-2.1 TaxID=3160833 RepID=UPI00386EE085